MATYAITGKLGAGKTLASVGRIRDYLEQGRPVASNLDLYLENLLPLTSRTTVTRLPDKPTHDDLMAIGLGNDTPDESRNGGLFLDECASFLNSRDFADKGRQPFIDWMLHARKRGWDVFFIIQDISLIDKQIREALIEHLVICKRLDRVAIPFVSSITKLLGFRVMPPKMHLAIVRYGIVLASPISDRWLYRGASLYRAYDTRQIFRPLDLTSSASHVCAPASLLSAWHVSGRYLGFWAMYKTVIFSSFLTGAIVALLLFFSVGKLMGYHWVGEQVASSSKAEQVPLASVDADKLLTGYFKREDGRMVGILQDGRIVLADFSQQTPKGIRLKVGDTWYSKEGF